MILNKTDNFRSQSTGLYGNKLRTWYNVDDFLKSDHVGTVSIRYAGDRGGMFVAYNVKDVNSKIEEFLDQGAKRELFIVNESAPDEKLLLQGELMYDHRGYCLFYSTEKGKMRDCLKNGKHVAGLRAKLLLQYVLFPASFDDVLELLILYPEHVIEFGTYENRLGDCPNRNTIIWEIRKY